jgi:hypothetical protein
MILYKAIKYVIFDICIETVFNAVIKNICKVQTEVALKDLREGMELRTVYIYNHVMFNCTVGEVRRNPNGTTFIRLNFGKIGYGSVSFTTSENDPKERRFYK